LFSRLYDHDPLLRGLLDVSLPFVCDNFRCGPSSTLHYCCRGEGEGGPAAWRKKTDFEDEDISKVGVQLPPPTQCGSHYVKQRAPATPAAGTAVTQQ
jgi:hypothetical protein